MIYNVCDFGAKGDGKFINTSVFQSIINKCAENGGGTILIPSGQFISGTIFLQDNVHIELQHGCAILINRDEDDISDIEELTYNPHADNETTYFRWGLFVGEDVDNISITGSGSIEGNGYLRGGPKPIALKSCSQIKICGITISRSPNYAISMLDCEYVQIDGVKIQDSLADGIDPDNCRNVVISNCIVESADDAICPKSSPALGKLSFCANITVSNCLLATNCNCFKIGTETSGDFRNITVTNCTMYPLGYGRPPSSGIAIESVDGSNIDGITISNISMQGIDCPIFIRLGNRGRAQEIPTPGSISNISISNVVAQNAKMANIIAGIPNTPISNISISQVIIHMLRIREEDTIPIKSASCSYQEINEAEAVYPDPEMFIYLPVSGWFIRHAQNVDLSNCHTTFPVNDPRIALYIEDCSNLVYSDSSLRWQNPALSKGALSQDQVHGCALRLQNSSHVQFRYTQIQSLIRTPLKSSLYGPLSGMIQFHDDEIAKSFQDLDCSEEILSLLDFGH